MLGVEAGVSVFDLEDKVRLKYEEMMRQNPDMTFDEFSESFLKDWEDNVYYRMISPAIRSRRLKVCRFFTRKILRHPAADEALHPSERLSNLDESHPPVSGSESLGGNYRGLAYRDLIESGRYRTSEIHRIL